MNRWLAAWTVLAAAAGGCADIPVASGPIYPVAGLPEMPDQPSFPLSLRDVRPAWEKQYRKAGDDPLVYRSGVGFVPLENFRPALRDQIVDSVARRTQELSPPPSWGEIELRSFRVVLNQVERLRQEYEELERRSRGHWGLAVSSDGGLAVGVGLTSAAAFPPGPPDPFRRPGRRDPWPPPPRPMAARSEIVDGQRLYLGPPQELPMKYGPGVTCEIEATVTLGWVDGRSAEFEVLVELHVPPADRTVYDSEHDLATTVRQAVDEFGAKVRWRAATFAAGEEGASRG